MILAIETATHAIGVALADGNGLIASTEVHRGRRHAETVVPAIDELLRHVEGSLRDVSAIAVDIGPGLFTGLRVGVATAKALAMANDLPIAAVSSLHVVATTAILQHGRLVFDGGLHIAALLDARRKELYAQMFVATEADGVASLVRPVGEPMVGPHEVVRKYLDLQSGNGVADVGADIDWWAAGEGFDAYPAVVEGHAAIHVSPSASIVARIGASMSASQYCQPDAVELLYLRPPDAEINWKTR